MVGVAINTALTQTSDSAVLNLPEVNSGWYRSDGFRSTTHNYIVGRVSGREYHNYLIYDLSGVSGVITSASISLENPVAPPQTGDGYFSPDSTETYTLFDVVRPVSALLTGSGSFANFADLGSGDVYGSVVTSAADNGGIVTVNLNATALAALNSATGLFAFGGALTSLGLSSSEYVFGWTHEIPPPNTVLTLTTSSARPSTPVPEPSLALGGFVLLLGMASRRKRTARP